MFDNFDDFFGDVTSEKDADFNWDDLSAFEAAFFGSEAAETPIDPPLNIPAGFRRGVWVDVGGHHLHTNLADHVAALQACGITDACVMFNGVSNRQFGFTSVSADRLREFATALQPTGIQITLTSWIRPSAQYIDGVIAGLPDITREIGARAVEFDAEETWTRATPAGVPSHDAAADRLFDGLRAALPTDTEVAVTCQVDPLTSPRLTRLLTLADVVIPQAYSAFHGGAANHAVDAVYGPRGIQRRAAARLAEALPTQPPKPMIMGLAAYSRGRWPRQSARDILTMELRETLTLAATNPIRGVRYWSWKHIEGFNGRLGSPSNQYTDMFLRDIR
ncbi:MAG: hypothetical protein IPK82_40350 [Polyangiaceae bacterium]|nr:hypothetical protein [Polyangiaceae bacterium]